MFKKRSDSSSPPETISAAAPADRITSVLSSGISWKGQLGGSGGVRIEGTFEGEIALRGILVVGETGRVTCQVLRANTVVVAGVVRADIVSERLDIRSTGRVWGSVVTAAFSTEEGAFLRGQVTMEEKVDIGVGPAADAASEPASEGDGEGPLLAE